jgi:hypothetical protein
VAGPNALFPIPSARPVPKSKRPRSRRTPVPASDPPRPFVPSAGRLPPQPQRQGARRERRNPPPPPPTQRPKLLRSIVSSAWGRILFPTSLRHPCSLLHAKSNVRSGPSPSLATFAHYAAFPSQRFAICKQGPLNFLSPLGGTFRNF